MGKEPKLNRIVEEPQADIAQAPPHAPLAPQTPEMLAPAKLLGQPVRALIDGRMQTIFLTEYEAGGTYWGMAVRNNPAEGNEKMPKFTPVSGLRPYPYAERPDYRFQFVSPGEDESVLINIAGQR